MAWGRSLSLGQRNIVGEIKTTDHFRSQLTFDQNVLFYAIYMLFSVGVYNRLTRFIVEKQNFVVIYILTLPIFYLQEHPRMTVKTLKNLNIYKENGVFVIEA